MRDCKTQQSTEGLQQVQQLIPCVFVEIVSHAVRDVKENKVFAENLRIELSNYSYQQVQLHAYTLSKKNTPLKAVNF